jgi:hypothetical protein
MLKVSWQVVATVLVAAAWVSGNGAAEAQEERWQVRVSGAGVQSSGGGSDLTLGYAFGLEYRLSPRLSLELGGFTARPETEQPFDFGFFSSTIESSYRITPVLARLNVHLTPGRRVDVYGGPVAGHVEVSDVTLRVPLCEVCLPLVVSQQRWEAEDQLTWGAALGADVPLGRTGSLLTAGVTYLRLPLEIEGELGGALGFPRDVDPWIVQLGYGARF